MRKSHGFFSWALTSVLTVISAFGIVALTTGNTVASSVVASNAAATSASTAAAPATAAHLTTYKVTYHDDSSNTSGDH
jgi:uncharacterized membrane-anchored protein YitT (DUF2179 family)